MAEAIPHATQFYINGEWVDPVEPRRLPVIDPASEEVFTEISLGSAADVEKAVAAARTAFDSFSQTPKGERIDMLKRMLDGYKARSGDLASAISREMGAPAWLAKKAQVPAGIAHLMEIIKVLESFEFSEVKGTTLIAREPIGVVGMITPWNWPLNQMMCKVGPAIAAGCTMILKPSEIAPISGTILAEIIHEAGVPAGVFNLVHGDGPGVGQAISSHPDVDMVSFTGSTRAGIAVAKAAADTVKRVHQELGGKSPNIILDDADLAKSVTGGVRNCFNNSGQSCNAPTRMLVPAARQAEAIEAAKAAAEKTKVGDPAAEDTNIGPVVSAVQFEKIQKLIEAGIAEGATLVTGGPGRPEGVNRGYYVRPTVFADVRNDMTIAREEIFGPVLAIMPYESEDEAVKIANDTPYGLSSYVSSGDLERARKVASRIRAGNVHVNGAGPDFSATFGGYKQSGNGREWGEHGLEEFLEVKSVMGYAAA